MDQGATSAAMSYSRRRDAATTHVTAGGPTLRRTAALQTHATQHGRQRWRTRHRPMDSPQLSRLTHDPARSTTSADSLPPDGLTSALPADPRRQYLPHLSTTSTTEQTARSTDTQSARRFYSQLRISVNSHCRQLQTCVSYALSTRPRVTCSTSGRHYFHVALTTVRHLLLSSDQLRAASLIGRNAVT